MKIKGLLLATFSLVGISGALAQVEYDDMYFNSEDRAKLKSQKATEVAFSSRVHSRETLIGEENTNPTDSYSARDINPEYTARQQSQIAQADEENYFVVNYQYNRSQQFSNWNNNFNDWYNSSWYRPNYYGAGMNSWNNSYYGYNSWNSPWHDPYWSHNGWSGSFGYQFGNSWNYGWGSPYSYWNRPYYGWNNPYGWDPYMNMYAGSYWNNYRYPTTIIVVNGERENMIHGKRPTRGTTLVSDRSYIRSRTSATNAVRNDDANSSGRISSQNTKQEEYYNRYNSRQRSSSYPSTYDNRSSTQNNRSRSWDNSSWDNSSYDNSRSTRTSSPSYSPSYSPSRSGGGTRTNSGGSTSSGRGRD